ncbi:hypothetical protein MIND_00465700 [Mycena indigotica]|uniref:Uncharacterized protein n=1 Tax=Mycena indigotica TaxID=2126181 RepID=A0A8H6SV41_9AGAR|nr:uncharacterized protein MIND_00465700 [Mycena indigotica]KAF7306740.1 hypothetical protein MIND_00465700 [Mycena indigotica]
MSLGRLVCALLTLFCSFTLSLASAFINGQTFTNGLAIVDAPSPNSPAHAGATLPIAVDVSGNGKLPAAARLPGSGLPTGFQSLTIFLVSAQTNANITVVDNSTFLTGESGSTVKHLNFVVPSCLKQGNYNLTFHEASVFNSGFVYAITPILVQVENPNPSGSCVDSNPLLPQPQPSIPLLESPFISPDLFTLTLTMSNGILNLPTVTVTSQATPTTVVVISETTVTRTDQGTPTTYTATSTLTTVVSVNKDNRSGFVPINAANQFSPSIFGLCSFLLLYWRILL